MHINATSTRRLRLGDILRQHQVITQEELDSALEIQKSTGERLGKILCDEGYATEEQVCYHLARQLGVPYMSLQSRALAHDVVSLIPRELATRHSLIAIDKMGQFVTIAMSDPLDQAARKQVAELTGLKLQFVLSTSDDINGMINRYYVSTLQTEEQAESLEETDDVDEDEEVVPAGVHVIELDDSSAESLPAATVEPTPTAKADVPTVPPPELSSAGAVVATRHVPKLLDGLAHGESFHPDLTLDTFVFPQSTGLNKAIQHLCYAADRLLDLIVVEAGVGMGKTHLLHAIGNALVLPTPPKHVEYLDGREIMMRIEEGPSVRQLCSDLGQELTPADVVLLDNWHELVASPATQTLASVLLEELLHAHVQVVCALCPVDGWTAQNDSLLGAGLVFEVEMPAMEGRIGILTEWQKQATAKPLPESQLRQIAAMDAPSVRILIAHWRRQQFEEVSLSHHAIRPGSPAD